MSPNEEIKPVHPQTKPLEKSYGAANDTLAVPQSVPTPSVPTPRPYSKTEYRPDQTPWWKTLFESSAVLIALGLLVVNYQQQRSTQVAAGAAQAAATTATTTMHLDQKAWLMFDHDYSDSLKLIDKEAISVPIQFKDIGKTPARHVEGFIVVSETKAGEAPTFKPEFVNKLRGGLVWPSHPDQTTASELDPKEHRVKATSPKCTQFESGKIVFVVWGRVTYDDIFQDSHWIKFCHTITHDPSVRTKECADYNEIDTLAKK